MIHLFCSMMKCAHVQVLHLMFAFSFFRFFFLLSLSNPLSFYSHHVHCIYHTSIYVYVYVSNMYLSPFHSLGKMIILFILFTLLCFFCLVFFLFLEMLISLHSFFLILIHSLLFSNIFPSLFFSTISSSLV
jgi:hypothetical protein